MFIMNLHVPLEGLEAGGQLIQLCFLLVLYSVVEELANSVHLLITEVTTGAEIEGQGREFNVDPSTSSN